MKEKLTFSNKKKFQLLSVEAWMYVFDNILFDQVSITSWVNHDLFVDFLIKTNVDKNESIDDKILMIFNWVQHLLGKLA